MLFQDIGTLISVMDKNPSLDKCMKPKSNITFNVGKVIRDRVSKEEIKLLKFPLKQSHLSLNLSDEAFEKMGDSLSDNIDTGHAQISTGNEKFIIFGYSDINRY